MHSTQFLMTLMESDAGNAVQQAVLVAMLEGKPCDSSEKVWRLENPADVERRRSMSSGALMAGLFRARQVGLFVGLECDREANFVLFELQ